MGRRAGRGQGRAEVSRGVSDEVSGSEISGEEFRRKKEGVCWAGKLLTIAGAGKEGVSTRIGGGTRGGTRGGQGGGRVACKTRLRADALGRVGTGWCGTGYTVAGTYLGQRTRKRESVRRV